MDWLMARLRERFDDSEVGFVDCGYRVGWAVAFTHEGKLWRHGFGKKLTTSGEFKLTGKEQRKMLTGFLLWRNRVLKGSVAPFHPPQATCRNGPDRRQSERDGHTKDYLS